MKLLSGAVDVKARHGANHLDFWRLDGSKFSAIQPVATGTKPGTSPACDIGTWTAL